jgi:hypothetical protein
MQETKHVMEHQYDGVSNSTIPRAPSVNIVELDQISRDGRARLSSPDPIRCDETSGPDICDCAVFRFSGRMTNSIR